MPHDYPQMKMNNERIFGCPSLGKWDYQSILRYPFVRQGRGVWHTPSKHPRMEMKDRSFRWDFSNARAGTYYIRPTNIPK